MFNNKNKGPGLIAATLAVFHDVREKLQLGIDHSLEQKAANAVKRQELDAHDEHLDSHIQQARTVISKVSEFLK
jgi:hypothetical protein